MSKPLVEEGIEEIIDEAYDFVNTLIKERRPDDKSVNESIYANLMFADHIAFVQIGLIYQLLKRVVISSRSIEAALGKLPDNSQFDEVRNELQKHRETVIDTLLPLKEMAQAWKEYKEREKKAGDIYD